MVEKDKINVKDRNIVVPGQVLAEGMENLPSGKAKRAGNKIIATTVGLVNLKGHVIKVIALSGKYNPKRNDTVVSEIIDVGKYGWRVNLNCGYDAEINVRDTNASLGKNLSNVYDVGDYVLASVTEITDNRYIKLSTKFRPNGLLRGGTVIEVSPSKIPRIIGKEGSMIHMLKDESGCNIFVGQNGLVWVNGTPENMALAIKAIKKIESDSHIKGLTEEIQKMFKTGKKSKGGKK